MTKSRKYPEKKDHELSETDKAYIRERAVFKKARKRGRISGSQRGRDP